MSSQRKYEHRIVSDHQKIFLRQSHILRKNIFEWDQMLVGSATGEEWPSMVGRLNAALNQTTNLDKSIEDVMNHFVYEPKKATMNPQDIPFFLSVRLVDGANGEESNADEFVISKSNTNSPQAILTKYEKDAAEVAREFEENMVRF
ncbi:hypothetical protein CTEN210_15013 [Chaetoceros tenuissimus]|uniref:Uncharacterized protein n=1 Tax=Chaetoceros tenuissimus TaxID=426638 RepID=A0AAD3D6U1_9STRA|nr:hypothetical protein CTEN210_15013 [Chaetoceros tenuissimus]